MKLRPSVTIVPHLATGPDMPEDRMPVPGAEGARGLDVHHAMHGQRRPARQAPGAYASESAGDSGEP